MGTMRKSVIAAALLAFAIAGCGGGGTTIHSGGAKTGSQSPGAQGGGADVTRQLSPYQQQKYDSYAQAVCRETDDTIPGIGPFTFGMWISFIKKDLNLSEADAIAFVSRVASQQCPENLRNISQWQHE
jgi:hypothetical protein